MSDHVEKFVRRAVQSFVGDPPDTDFQCGYLGAMLAVANYALGLPMETSPYAKAQKLWNDYEFDRPRCDEDAASKGGSRP